MLTLALGIRLSTPSSMPRPARRMGTTVIVLPASFSTSTLPHQPSMAGLGAGDRAECAGEHAQTGAQDGSPGALLAGQLLDFLLAAPAIDGVTFDRHVLGRLVGQQRSDFLCQFTEVLGADIVAAHQAE